MTDASKFAIAECAIRQLNAHYLDAVWRQDMKAFGDCFTEDCRWTIGGAIIRGRDAIVEYNERLFRTKFRKLFVTLRTPILTVGDGTAFGRTYMSAQNILIDGTPYAPWGM